ncbi:NUDIX hydrolase [Tessaracoccus flavus]|uniref:NUDIX hydrolase n=1 Tax=Tessaracoccus flavus TaxID=1610493 RepID=A0A1Q2CJ39_9ACTN|nr:NUDIX hydrolase [Tessaracoccus flavus]
MGGAQETGAQVEPVVRDSAGIARYRHEAICAVLRVTDGRLAVLLSTRVSPPFAGLHTLPSGAVEPEETLDQAVLRHLAAKVDVAGLAHLEQLGTQSDPHRDPAQRTIGTGYLGLMQASNEPHLPDGAGWFDVDELPAMGFDHAAVVARAIERLRAKLSYTNLGFALAPDEFTIGELREVYVAALGHDVSATNLQRILTRRGQLEATGAKHPVGSKGGRPAQVFRFVDRTLVVTDPFAVLRPD